MLPEASLEVECERRCSECLGDYPREIKALYRRAQARKEQGGRQGRGKG